MIRALTYMAACAAIAFALAMVAMLPGARAQQPLPCQVVGIVDGDTWDCSSGIRIRGWGYDSPEGRQPYGREARDALASLISGKTLACARKGANRDRVVAQCWLPDRREVASAMVRAGTAWDYVAYSRGKYAAEEQQARSAKRGLWAQPSPQAPWEWRAERRTGR